MDARFAPGCRHDEDLRAALLEMSCAPTPAHAEGNAFSDREAADLT